MRPFLNKKVDVEPFFEGLLEKVLIDQHPLAIKVAGDYLIWLETDARLGLELWKEGNFVPMISGINAILDLTLEQGDYMLFIDDWRNDHEGPYIIYSSLHES